VEKTPENQEADQELRTVKDPKSRRCVASGEVLPVTDLIRFVVDPANTVVADLSHKLPGRGMWVSANRSAVDLAVKKGLFPRAAKEKVIAPEDLADTVAALLRTRVRAGLGLGSRAGGLVTGFEKVRGALRAGTLAVLIEASDGSEDGRNKIFALAHGLGHRPLILGCFDGDELGLALGQANVIHAALSKGPLARRLEGDVQHLAGFQPLAPSDWRLPGASEDKSLSFDEGL